MERGVPSFRHPERSRGIFFVCRLLFSFVNPSALSTVIPRHMKHTVFPVPRFPHNFCLTANEKDFSLPLEMTMQERRHSPSFLWKEVARSAGGWLRSFSLSANPLPFGHPPFHGKGGWYEMTGISTLSRCQSKSGPPYRSPPILPASIS